MTPFSSNLEACIDTLGERELIRNIASWLGESGQSSPSGIGDDTAVIPPSTRAQLITVDSLVYGRHFDDDTAPEAAGAKLLKRNLSDLAAMGGRPGSAVIACFLPPNLSLAWLESFYRGLAKCALTFNTRVVGGDISSSNNDLAFSLTLLGQVQNPPLTRKSTHINDTLWVSGSLGGSLLGKHLNFTPRIGEGGWLAGRSGVSACMDISDGLATDIDHLLASGQEALLEPNSIPVSSAAHELSKTSGKDALCHAMVDGEDFELLFTLTEDVDPVAFSSAWKDAFDTPLSCIGRIQLSSTSNSHIRWADGSPWDKTWHGYEHLGNT